jgi:hypothetical protein
MAAHPRSRAGDEEPISAESRRPKATAPFRTLPTSRRRLGGFERDRDFDFLLAGPTAAHGRATIRAKRLTG